MIGATSPWLWYITRSTAAVGLVLLTASAILGIITNVRLGWHAWPRFASQELHKRVSIMAMVFVALHVFLLGTDVKKGSHWLLVVLAICVIAALGALTLRVVRALRLRGHLTTPPKKVRR